ncbi:DEAD/DEAH box helicase [Streptomyces coelicoflavus]|uniref:DEAD/DEAH box helicase n=1 Tax=Streptomyces coelicoflavus TaxID=285562 RepID=UPI003F4A4514
MRPTLAADQVRASLSQYLSTTYALADESTRRALEQFLGDTTDGIFRGPYLRIRTPFRAAGNEDWQRCLQWWPRGDFRPYRHQARAWERLSTLHSPAEPTLVTTGTGSGKTESFLVPLLDHCRREREAGRTGVKAVLLYPMNALATDQAQRINGYLEKDTRLERVRAALYIGDKPSREFKDSVRKVAVERDEIRRTRPDILITNYKMLDLLLQRPEDQKLWQDSSLAYVVLDEFHTYDGAQGTDVAMLLRRLGSVTGLARDGRPLGPVCPVATSATLGESGDGTGGQSMLEVAEQVFGVPFPPEAVVGESRRTVQEFAGESDFSLPFPAPQEVVLLGDPTRDTGALDRLAQAFTGESGLSPEDLGARLRRHRLTAAVLEILDGSPRTLPQLMEVLPRYAYHWGMAAQHRPTIAAQALARYVALLSVARDPDEPGRPLLSIEMHHWVRSVARVLRGITPARAEFRWDDERVASGGRLAHKGVGDVREVGDVADAGDVGGKDTGVEEPVAPADDSAPSPAEVFLPAVFCRECGRSGWAALSPESDAAELEMNAAKIRRASVGRDKRRVRNMIAATVAEAYDAAFVKEPVRAGATVMVLDGDSGRLRPLSPDGDFEQPRDGAGPGVAKSLRGAAFVVVDLANDRAAETDQCPACRTFNAIRFLGTGLAALAAASITQLFTGGELDENLKENKTLLFNDSVQDAAHRAGYVASRSYTFSFRSLLASRVDEDTPITLSDLAADILEEVVESRKVQVAVVPPDLHVHRGVDTLLSGRSHGSKRTWELIAQRLAFAAVMEFGLRSRQGRTLELTRTVAADVPLGDPDDVAELVRELLHTTPGEIALPDGAVPGPDRFVGYVRGLLDRMRIRGAVRHAWLDPWIDQAGVRRWPIWGGRREGMPAFSPGVSAPAFVLGSPKKGSDDFDVLTGRLGWYQDYTRRSLGFRQADAANHFLTRLFPALAEAGIVSVRTAKDGATRVYGLQPGHVQVRGLADEVVAEAGVRCPACSWQQTVHPDLAHQWHGQPCPRYRCKGHLLAGRDGEGSLRRRDYTDDFYRRMYREAGVFTINTAEHTGTLERRKREAVEKAFREGTDVHYANPQVLSCTPTLELGIDIGDLSAVVLASLPKGPANYVQRVGRAGRTTGNAYLLTMVDRGPRDRYYLEDPLQMIAGDIRPPGCFLSAGEILRRQYLAHLLDLAGAGRLPMADGTPAHPLPRLATALFGPAGWLSDFEAAALANGARLVEGFLRLFPPYDESRGTGVSPEAADDLRRFATEGLRDALAAASREWESRRGELQHRIVAIDDALGRLVAGDPEHERQGRELRAERRAVSKRAGEISRGTAHGALVDFGLLPNYSLVDSTTELEATLTWREETADGGNEYHSKVLKYERSARFALEDYAPGNHYYVQGYKHHISGLDIGSPGRPAWTWWRICPDCGHVRTHRAEQDSSACPRCRSAAIGDVGCLHKALVPHRVQSRDQRDDARVRDDTDERERRHYTVVPAVDIPHDSVVEAWRHPRATFGWEFTRQATVRHVNVGASRVDAVADDAFAGRRVRLNPFWVCESCGQADPDGGPVTAMKFWVAEASVPVKSSQYHRPWCPKARTAPGDSAVAQTGVKVLLAHVLETEALRILIPAVTAHTQERLVSFKAALLAGIAGSYGGDPDHLAVVTNSMPDADSGDRDVRRHFLVLYDTLPRGTGYLQRLAGPDGLRDVLARARSIIEMCVCVEEGRPACHRCLLRHVADGEYEDVSREHALDMLGELFGTDGAGWDAKPVTTTGDIAIGPQVESELEALFRQGLLDWAGRDDVDEASVRTALTPDGERSTELRLTAPDGSVTRWQMETQTDLGFTRPDVVFRRLDADGLRVAVYLDGYRYHASPECNRLADDAVKRARLRALGWQVFQLTWEDVEAWTGRRAPVSEPVWVPYQNTAQKTALDIHRRLHAGDTRDLPRFVWANPVDTLIGYLTRPEPELWRTRTQSALAGFATVSATSRALADGPDIADRIAAALAGQPLAGGKGAVQVMATKDGSGCPLTIVLDLRKGQSGAVWSAVTVLPDDAAAISADETAHRRRWQAWLYWTNLLQFLNEGEGDGVQLTTALLSGFDVVELAATGGAGWLTSQRRAAADTESAVTEAPRPAGVAGGPVRDPAWDEILAYLVDEPGLADLATALADLGAPVPEAGYELGDAAWSAELAWPASRIGVVLAHEEHADGTPDTEAQNRDKAYADAGWQVRTAHEWGTEELAALLGGDGGTHDDEEHHG